MSDIEQALQFFEEEKPHPGSSAKSARVVVLLMALAIFFLSGFTLGCAAGHAFTEKPQEENAGDPQRENEPVQTGEYAPQPAAPQPLSQPEQETDSEQPACRDDIVSGGRLLSYELQNIMQDRCRRCNVPYALALAIADVESRFDPNAESSTDDYGLMQINSINFNWLRELGMDPLTPEGNITAGVYIISRYLAEFGDVEMAVMAYNNGAAGARRLLEAGTYRTPYSEKVMEAYERWTSLLEE